MMQTLTPQQVSIRNQWAFYMNSLSRFDSAFIIEDILPRERERIHAKRDADRNSLTPGDMIYLRAAIDTLADRGIVNV